MNTLKQQMQRGNEMKNFPIVIKTAKGAVKTLNIEAASYVKALQIANEFNVIVLG